jgi:hypothetical protein
MVRISSVYNISSNLSNHVYNERYKFIKRMEKIYPEAGKGYFGRGLMGND